MAEIEFYRDDKGSACARGRDTRLAVFLQTDLQGSVAITRDLIAMLENGHERAEFTGNGHSVSISPVMAMIESNFDDEAPDRRMTRTQLLQHVQAWLTFIDN